MTLVQKMPSDLIDEKLPAFHILVVQITIPCINQHEMDVGHNYNTTWQYIDATTLAEHLGLIMCEAMLGFHILTGSYYTSVFFMQGKIRPLTTMEKSLALFLFFKLGLLDNGDTEMTMESNSFVCCIYGKSNVSSFNFARNVLFHQHCSPKENAEIKGTDST